MDFLIQRGGRYVLIEIKWSETPTKRDMGAAVKVAELLGKDNLDALYLISRSIGRYDLALEDGLHARVIPIKEISELFL